MANFALGINVNFFQANVPNNPKYLILSTLGLGNHFIKNSQKNKIDLMTRPDKHLKQEAHMHQITRQTES